MRIDFVRLINDKISDLFPETLIQSPLGLFIVNYIVDFAQ
ncbi:hypothetical protein AQPE_3736 [Aquipluma nitroreducens]|uniref:Uncharacterized protein n=1 Tax=Aquipluma nitroreducens TaxID=2010828 RepID=A0A5K7SD71_9BACT|nr:hypothetical protein AQPE_3736 [Aquipluma nitroreducens]